MQHFLIDEIDYIVTCDEKITEKAKQLCFEVYLKEGYITANNTPDLFPEQEKSIKIVALNKSKKVVGTLSVITESPFKQLQHWQGLLFPAFKNITNAVGKNFFSLGCLAADKKECTLKIASGLYLKAYRWALQNKMDYGIITMDARALRSLEITGWKVVRIGEPSLFMGSLTVPGLIPIKEQTITPVYKTLAIHPALNRMHYGI